MRVLIPGTTSWSDTAVVFLVALALVFLPGLAAGLALRLRPLAALALAPLLSTSCLAVSAVVAGALGVRWGLLAARRRGARHGAPWLPASAGWCRGPRRRCRRAGRERVRWLAQPLGAAFDAVWWTTVASVPHGPAHRARDHPARAAHARGAPPGARHDLPRRGTAVGARERHPLLAPDRAVQLPDLVGLLPGGVLRVHRLDLPRHGRVGRRLVVRLRHRPRRGGLAPRVHRARAHAARASRRRRARGGRLAQRRVHELSLPAHGLRGAVAQPAGPGRPARSAGGPGGGLPSTRQAAVCRRRPPPVRARLRGRSSRRRHGPPQRLREPVPSSGACSCWAGCWRSPARSRPGPDGWRSSAPRRWHRRRRDGVRRPAAGIDGRHGCGRPGASDRPRVAGPAQLRPSPHPAPGGARRDRRVWAPSRCSCATAEHGGWCPPSWGCSRSSGSTSPWTATSPGGSPGPGTTTPSASTPWRSCPR